MNLWVQVLERWIELTVCKGAGYTDERWIATGCTSNITMQLTHKKPDQLRICLGHLGPRQPLSKKIRTLVLARPCVWFFVYTIHLLHPATYVCRMILCLSGIICRVKIIAGPWPFSVQNYNCWLAIWTNPKLITVTLQKHSTSVLNQPPFRISDFSLCKATAISCMPTTSGNTWPLLSLMTQNICVWCHLHCFECWNHY